MRAIPIVEPNITHAVGLVVPDREPTTPLITALIAEARQLAKVLGKPAPTDTVQTKKLGRRGRPA